jgi:hypothetical protein
MALKGGPGRFFPDSSQKDLASQRLRDRIFEIGEPYYAFSLDRPR